jgi:hypothetical protein
MSILLIAFLLGSGLSRLFIKYPQNDKSKIVQNNNEIEKNTQSQTVVKTDKQTIKFVCIQIGVFDIKENAEIQKNKLKEICNPFSITEGNKTRIFSGIYNEEDAVKNIQLLNDKGFQNAKLVFEVSKAELCDAEIIEIINGNIKILNKLMEKDVLIKTEDFKKWTMSLQNGDSKNKNYTELDELKKYINTLPKDMSMNLAEDNYITLYNILKKITSK